ncbi:cell division protein ZipA [Halomonas sp. E14]|uniref:cell division protein ZipA n=1 Tax=Halomonas sp. E14 TaxID=3397245 RepID=UPI00403EE147
MELREWLIILGLALVTLIVIDGVRRLKRQRRVPRLDQVGENNHLSGQGATAEDEGDPNWELPNGGARVVSPAKYDVKAKPKLERQEHPGPSRVLAEFKERPDPSPVTHSEPAAATRSKPAVHASTGAAVKAAPDAVAAALRSGAATPADAASAAAVEKPSPATDPAPAKRETERSEPTLADLPSHDAAPPAKPIEVESAKIERDEIQSAAAERDAVAARQASTSAAEPAATKTTATTAESPQPTSTQRREPVLSALDDEPTLAAADEPLMADPEDHDELHDEDERYRLVDLEGMGDSIKSSSRRMGQSVQRFGLSMQQRMAKRREQKREEKARREKERAEKAAREAERRRVEAEAQAARDAERRRLEAEVIDLADDDDPLFAPSRPRSAEFEHAAYGEPAAPLPEAINDDDDVVRAHPTLARALRHNVNAERARETLSQADEIIVISVLSRDEEGFSGGALLNLMLACGLRYSSEMGIFHRFETENPDSELQFSMVNVLKPGTFPIEAMDEFRTPGITLLMPLPGALDTAAAFEAMVETAMVIVRNLGGELKDENHSVMTAQTVEFARQRVKEFERRNRLNRYQVN